MTPATLKATNIVSYENNNCNKPGDNFTLLRSYLAVLLPFKAYN
jgi:hypothetical protein